MSEETSYQVQALNKKDLQRFFNVLIKYDAEKPQNKIVRCTRLKMDKKLRGSNKQ